MPPPAAPANRQKVLVVAPAWVGDLVMCQTLLKVLAERRPSAVIDVLAPPWGVPLVQRMPEVRRSLPLDVNHGQLGLAVRWRTARGLRSERYAQAIVIQRSLKSALTPWMAGIPRRTGVLGEARYGLINDVRDVDTEALPLNHTRYATLALEPGEAWPGSEPPPPALRIDPENRRARMDELGLDPSGGPIALAPGAAYGPAKRWPLRHWIALARALVSRGRPVWVLGSESESAMGEQIRREVGEGVHNLSGRTRLVDVVDLASTCARVVSNDSGLMHLAAAAGAPVLALFGSTSPRRTPPLGTGHRVLWRQLDCSPCFARECPLGHLDCLTGISPGDVLAECLSEDDGPGLHGTALGEPPGTDLN